MLDVPKPRRPVGETRELVRHFVAGACRRNGRHVRLRLVAAGLRENRCERCMIDTWLGFPLTPELHHINGDNRDNRVENLALLCPNCHSLTTTWGGRNKGRRRVPVPTGEVA